MSATFRTRFAPSPTGPPHLGTLHTALFAYLAARNAGGAFIVRIDDTDSARSSESWQREILAAVRYLGLEWDEGPGIGGPFAPYSQSERLDGYRKAAEKLTADHFLYPCFCTEDDLNAQRAAARASGKPFIYDGRCRRLGERETADRIARGDDLVRRFHVDPERLGERVEFDDLVWGPQSFRTVLIGDFVCMRGDGRPTYMFASPLDDAAMGITHVIRGSDHISNTPAQMLVLRALGHPPPVFAHLPLIVGIGGKKLSKRDSLSGLDEIRSRLPAALVNHLALLGWTHPEGREVFVPEEAVRLFSFDRVSKSPAAHDPARLAWLEREHLKGMSAARIMAAFENSRFGDPLDWQADSRASAARILDVVRDEITSFESISADVVPLLKSPDPSLLETEFGKMDPKKTLAALNVILAHSDGHWMSHLETLAADQGKKDVYMPVRIALTGAHRGFELSKLLRALGADEVLRRVSTAKGIVERLGPMSSKRS